MTHMETAGENTNSSYRLLLFVAGDEHNSRLARENLSRLRDSLPDHVCEVKVIDVLEDYRAALENNVLVTPCLIRPDSTPPLRVVGSLTDMQRVRAALGIPGE
jgi:circadian clock protein KaiB